jgi:DNA polymerase III delta prime subunit
MDTVHAENRLPHDQPPIYTSAVNCLIGQANLLRNVGESPATVGMVVGAPGTGKTIAAYCYQDYLAREEPEQRSKCALIPVLPQVTAKDTLSSILHRVGEHSHGHTLQNVFHQTIDVLQQRKTRLLILDGSDYLERETLEILSRLVEQTSCSLLLIGLPQLSAHLRIAPSFAGLIGLTLQFRPLPDTEVYELFLPQLVLPCWEFDSTNEEDLRLGRYLWKHARPSLRRVRTILAYASQLAQMKNSKKITFEDLHMAVSMTYSSGNRTYSQENEENGENAESIRL